MKKLIEKFCCVFVLLICLSSTLKAQEKENLKFAYDAGFDFNTAWLWRGIFNGGMSFQPTADIGWDSEHTSFRVGVWANIGAVDGSFHNELDPSKVNGELDFVASLNLWGATIGVTNYYYCGKFTDGDLDFGHSSQTELSVGYDFGTLLNVPLSVTWNTLLHDGIAPAGVARKGRYSTYVDITYSHNFDKGWNLTGTVGFTPWTSQYTNYSGDFAVNNISLTATKTWNVKSVCDMSIYAQTMINPYYLPNSCVWYCVGYNVRF